jgi:hypothetical protein
VRPNPRRPSHGASRESANPGSSLERFACARPLRVHRSPSAAERATRDRSAPRRRSVSRDRVATRTARRRSAISRCPGDPRARARSTMRHLLIASAFASGFVAAVRRSPRRWAGPRWPDPR